MLSHVKALKAVVDTALKKQSTLFSEMCRSKKQSWLRTERKVQGLLDM